jgi:histidine phosphotransferase ChpT
MSEAAGVGDLELAALISSRICHDVISPVGAIANGLEILDEEHDQAMREQAMALIRKSTHQASAKLQFARLAYGAAGSAGAEIDLRDAERVARDFVQGGGKHTLSWSGGPATLPKDKVKLLLNLVALAVTALPRGGTIAVTVASPGFQILARGDSARLPERTAKVLSGAGASLLDSHSIQAYYATRVAIAAGMQIGTQATAQEVVLRAASV